MIAGLFHSRNILCCDPQGSSLPFVLDDAAQIDNPVLDGDIE
jgi:hypothetical protein